MLTDEATLSSCHGVYPSNSHFLQVEQIYFSVLFFFGGSGSVVSIESGYGLNVSITVLGTTQPPLKWVSVLSRGKVRPGRAADNSPLLVPSSQKSTAIPLLLL